MDPNNYRFIAFGAGQCSSVLPFILSDYDAIIFVNTGWELPLTYAWVEIVKKSFPGKFVQIDSKIPEGSEQRSPVCTKKFKVEPVRRYLRSIGVKKAIKYLGMTYEEKNRVRENSVKWIENQYPLVGLKWKREDCCKYLLDNIGFVPPRSGCTICKHFDREHLLHGIKKVNHSIAEWVR